MNSLVQHGGNLSEQALATAQWANPQDITNLNYKPGALWAGRAADTDETIIGFGDDRHALVVAGSRSGKGTGWIINNLCLWPGSTIVIDPKGENAVVSARRRANGSIYCHGIGQSVHILDPFDTVKCGDDDFADLKGSFNPLDAIDPRSDEAIDEASRIADAIVVIQSSNDPFWEESARTLIRGIILHVLTDPQFDDCRNLVTVRQLISRGDWIAIEGVKAINVERQAAGEEPIYEPDSPFAMLWAGMEDNPAYDGIIAGVGSNFGSMSEKTRDGIIQVANRSTEFIDSPGMRRCLSSSSFQISDLKTAEQGVSLYLSLPQRFMNTHFRWLRMMTSLIITEMEKVPGPPATGHPILMLLDEFAGLKKMEIIENAAAQIAGFGVKMCFILQSLTQLKTVYKENWEIFVGSAGTKLFFGVDDNFTREYISKHLGETEVTRTTQTRSQTQGTSRSQTHGESNSHTDSSSSSFSSSNSFSKGGSVNLSNSSGSGSTSDVGLFWNSARNVSANGSTSRSRGRSWSESSSNSSSYSNSHSNTFGESQSETRGSSESLTAGTNQGLHKRALLSPDEVGMLFSRVDEKANPAYPGLALAVASGKRPLIVRRSNYFEEPELRGYFDPHPDHMPPLTLEALQVELAKEHAEYEARLVREEAERQEQVAREEAERERLADERDARRIAAEQAKRAQERRDAIHGGMILTGIVLVLLSIFYVPVALFYEFQQPGEFSFVDALLKYPYLDFTRALGHWASMFIGLYNIIVAIVTAIVTLALKIFSYIIAIGIIAGIAALLAKIFDL